jgi:hypothetical protein
MFLEAELLMWSAHQDQIQTSRWHPNNLVGWQRIKKTCVAETQSHGNSKPTCRFPIQCGSDSPF